MKDDKYLRISQVTERTGLSRPTIYNMVKAGSFPASTALGARAVGWLESELLKWMEDRRSFKKTGHEAKPGDPVGRGGKNKKVADVTPTQSPAIVRAAQNKSTPKKSSAKVAIDDWGQDDAPHDPAEVEAFRLRMLANNKVQKQAKAPVVRRGKTIKIQLDEPKQRQSTSAHKGTVIAPAKGRK